MSDPILSRLIGQPCPLATGSRILTYARDSGGDTQERSVDEQLRLYDAYAGHFGLVIVRHFHDRARPGSSLVGRDGLEQLLREARQVLAGFVLRIDADRHGAKLTYTFPLNEKTASDGGSSGFHPTGSAPEAVEPIGCFEVSWRITRKAAFPRK